DQLEAEELVRDLLKFQKSNGRFVFGNFETLKSTLGPSFMEVVVRLRAKHHDFDTVVTIAMVALLEEQFQDCQELWVLITRKATAFINQCRLELCRISAFLPLSSGQNTRSSSSVIPTSTIIKNTFPTHHSIISQC
ncbi:hypothetical protein CEP51_016407, partial [Fusarium floridanum]